MPNIKLSKNPKITLLKLQHSPTAQNIRF